jgi:hypothetical protein
MELIGNSCETSKGRAHRKNVSIALIVSISLIYNALQRRDLGGSEGFQGLHWNTKCN